MLFFANLGDVKAYVIRYGGKRNEEKESEG